MEEGGEGVGDTCIREAEKFTCPLHLLGAVCVSFKIARLCGILYYCLPLRQPLPYLAPLLFKISSSFFT